MPYKVIEDWQGQRYCSMTLEWDYTLCTCDISMMGYSKRALQHFKHPPPTCPQHSPHAWQHPKYGCPTQYIPAPDTSPLLDAADTKHIQEVLKTLLYYAQAVDSTMLAAIGTHTAQQAKGTQHTMWGITLLLNYCVKHPNAVVRFIVAGDMVLHVKSEALYLSEPKALAIFHHHLMYHQLLMHPHLKQTAPSTYCAKSFVKWFPVPLRPSLWQLSFTRAKKRVPSALPWKNLVTPSHQYPSKLTTSLPQALPTVLLSKGAPKPSTCASIGFAIESARNFPHLLEKKHSQQS
jgi:hypothetical protein